MNEKVVELQHDIKESANKIWLAGLGALSMASQEGNKFFENLVEKGQSFEANEKPPVDAAKKSLGNARNMAGDVWTRFEDAFNTKVAVALQKIGVPTREEIGQLTDRVDALMEAIGKLNNSGAIPETGTTETSTETDAEPVPQAD